MGSRIRYRVDLTPKYKELYEKGLVTRDSRLSTITVGAMRGHGEDVVMENIPKSLNRLYTDEVVDLIKYFALEGRNLDDILKNVKYQQVK